MKNEYLIKKYAELEQMEKFTAKEQSEFSKRDRTFIRGIQISNKLSKRNAIKKYKDTIIKGDNYYKKLQKDTSTYIKEYYPIKDKQHKDMGIKEPAKTGKRKMRVTPTEIKKYINKISSAKVKRRIASAYKKYPDASLYELRYGVNSDKAQKYRINNNRPQQYEGRIINSKK
jgi:hypothetical protein